MATPKMPNTDRRPCQRSLPPQVRSLWQAVRCRQLTERRAGNATGSTGALCWHREIIASSPSSASSPQPVISPRWHKEIVADSPSARSLLHMGKPEPAAPVSPRWHKEITAAAATAGAWSLGERAEHHPGKHAGMHESEHAEVYRTRCAALTQAEELLEAAKRALHPEENLSRASELARACVALLDEAAAPTCFADIAQALEPRVESDMMDAVQVQRQIDSCVEAVARAQDLMRACGEQLSRGLCERAHGSLQDARSCLHGVGFTSLDSQLDLLHQHIEATQRLQREEAGLGDEEPQPHSGRQKLAVEDDAGIMRIRVADAVTTDASVLECECGSEDAIAGGDRRD